MSVVTLCPKCNSTFYQQYGNGRDILICTKCNYRVVVSVDIEKELPPTPNNYGVIKPKKNIICDDIDFGEIGKQTTKCDMIYEKIFEKERPEYNNKNLEEFVKNDIIRNMIEKEIKKLYKYQAKAFQKIRSGKDIVITAPTASGKTEAFLFPILDKIISNTNPGKVSALFIYPTKALAGDQMSNIKKYSEKCGVSIQKLDGSVQGPFRARVISNPPDILATNFDMLSWHLSRKDESGFSAKFTEMLSNLQVVVVDEAHSCTGFYGSNIRWVLKRLQRINPKIQFVASSATLDDPKGFCSRLFPNNMEHIKGKGARGETKLQFLNPNIPYLQLMIDLVRQFGLRNHQVMAFNKSRHDAEILAIDGSDDNLSIEVHKSGMDPNYRTSVEIGLRDNTVKAVSCTPTLELGINIGHIDAVISYYTPHNRLVQRIGRAGRKGQNAFAYMILDESDAITKYYIDNPPKYFEDKEHHIINFDNSLVDENQILLMAKDSPLSIAEQSKYSGIIAKLESKGMIENGVCTQQGWEQATLWSIRDMGNMVNLSDGKHSIGGMEMPIAFNMLYPGAIFFHEKNTYRVTRFVDGKYSRAWMTKENTSNHTQPMITKSFHTQNTLSKKIHKTVKMEYCRVHINQMIHAYLEKPRNRSGEGQGHSVDPPQHLNIDTLGVLLKFEELDQMDLGGDIKSVKHFSLHAVQHLLIHAARMIIGAENNEIGGLTKPDENTILLYDNSMMGGNGNSGGIYEKIQLILDRAWEIVDRCKCENDDGCPLCTHLHGCTGSNSSLLKEGAKRILKDFV